MEIHLGQLFHFNKLTIEIGHSIRDDLFYYYYYWLQHIEFLVFHEPSCESKLFNWLFIQTFFILLETMEQLHPVRAFENKLVFEFDEIYDWFRVLDWKYHTHEIVSFFFLLFGTINNIFAEACMIIQWWKVKISSIISNSQP